MKNTVDLLQIKIEKAKAELPEESRQAIDAVDWKKTILDMRVEKGYSFEQLEDLEIETELLLCGLLSPEDYPKELEKRMGVPKPQVNELVDAMNKKVFERIREELVKNIERKKIFEDKQKGEPKKPENNFESREELLKAIENPEKMIKRLESEKELPDGHSILDKKLSGSFQVPKVETDHSLNNMTKIPEDGKKVDPYRELPE